MPRKTNLPVVLSANKVPTLIAMLRSEYPDCIHGMLGKSLRIFYKNLLYAISQHLSDVTKPVFATVPTGQLTGEELNLLEHMFLNAGWDILERDRDYYKVKPGSGKLTPEQLIMKGELCPYCKVPTELKVGYYECPRCFASVECHPGTTAAMGFVARGTLRKLRHELHEDMDQLWKTGNLKRDVVYYRLRQKMGLTKAACHVAKFDEDQCKEAMKVIAEIKEELKNSEQRSVEEGSGTDQNA